MLNLAGFGPDEHQLFIQAGIEGLHDILGADLEPFRAQLGRAAHGAQLAASGGPDGRHLVGAGADARGGVALGRHHAHPDRRPRGPRRRHRRGAGHRRDRDPAVPQPRLGLVRAGPRPGGGLDRLHRRRPAHRDRRDPRRPRHRPARLRRRARRRAGAQRARAWPHARRPRRVRGRSTCSPPGPRSCSSAPFLLGARPRGTGPPVAAAQPRGAGDRGGDRRARHRRRDVLRHRVRGVPRAVLPGGLVPVRPGDRPPRPAVPRDVLGRDDDRGGDRDRRCSRSGWPGSALAGRGRSRRSRSRPTPGAMRAAQRRGRAAR